MDIKKSEIESSEKINDGCEKVRMKKQLGLLESVSIILGIIFGSGKRYK